ncbi:MAG: hypothetical protein ACTHLA_01525 [Asticcacaulis sp.]|uniref:hypothetical protein n=1 Tax=Asticcacaulis sp. TaxID=1872648 RepID=UPI003F7C2753
MRPTIGEALHKAEQALGQIETHERICALRYEGIEKAQASTARTLEGIADSLLKLDEKRSKDTSGIYARLWIFAAGIGSGMFAVIMALIFH